MQFHFHRHTFPILFTVHIDSYSDVYGFFYDSAFTADIVMNCVHKDYGINAFKRSLLSFFLQQEGFYPWFGWQDCLILQDRRYLRCVMRYRSLSYPSHTSRESFLQYHLWEINYLRFKFSVPVSRYCFLNRTGTCFDWFSVVSVPAVFGFLVSIIILTVSRIIVKLRFKSVFKNFSDRFFKYRTQIAVIFYIK